jgi:LmbE family N-acetylglucosaminyl deacetylase
MVTGGHPDDPECGCGGLIVRYAQAGYDVVLVYLTGGEAYVAGGEAAMAGRSGAEIAGIRRAEAERACEILGARPVFVGQVDARTEVSVPRYDDVAAVVGAEDPDAIFTHWPVDTHRDHRAMALLAYDAWLRHDRRAAFGYYEVLSGMQTQNFRPTDYVDVSAAISVKQEALRAHVSQGPDWWVDYHDEMARFRGRELGCDHAEAFVRHDQSPPLPLPR